jgi:branched-chain amino acid transport system permease protein
VTVQLAQNVFNGIVISGIYLLVALGLTVVFGMTRLINFAHGQILVVGTFLAYAVTARGYPFYVGLIVATLGTSVIAYLLERGLFRWTLANPLNGLIVGLGALIAGQVLVVKVWGEAPVNVAPQFRGGIDLFGVGLSYNRVGAVLLAVVTTAAFLFLLRKTPIGRQMTATQEDSMAAAHMGINVGRIITMAFVLGSAAAGAGGAVLGTLFPITAFMGGELILKGFAVALLGGLGNVVGAVVASFIYGIGETFIAGYWDPSWVPVYTFGIIVVILLIRPGGLFGIHGAVHADVFSSRQASGPRRHLQLPRPARLVLSALVVAMFPIGFALLPSSRLQGIFVLAAISAVVAYSLVVLYHQTGMLSAAQGGLMGIGAYTAGLLALHLHWSFWMTLVPAFAISAVAGAAIGIPVARAKGHYFVLLTFAFGALIVVLFHKLSGLTGGDQGLTMLDTPTPLGPLKFQTLPQMAYLTLAFAALTGLAVYAIGRSTLGARLASIRDNEMLAISLGLRVSWYKVLAFAISGGIAGIGGVLFLYQNSIIVPESFTILVGFQFIIILVLGGRSIFGPPVGVLVLSIIPELLNLDPQTKQLVFGITLIAVILLLPTGVLPSLRAAVEGLLDRFGPRPQLPAAAPASSNGRGAELDRSSVEQAAEVEASPAAR